MRRVWSLVGWVLLSCLPVSCVPPHPVEAPLIESGRGTPPPTAAMVSNVARSADVALEPGALIGSWEGIGTQDDGISWAMVVHISSLGPGTCARADYPTLRCRAEWECTGIRDGALHADERLLGDSATRCVDHGEMILRPHGEQLQWEWAGQGQTASSLLRRSR